MSSSGMRLTVLKPDWNARNQPGFGAQTLGATGIASGRGTVVEITFQQNSRKDRPGWRHVGVEARILQQYGNDDGRNPGCSIIQKTLDAGFPWRLRLQDTYLRVGRYRGAIASRYADRKRAYRNQYNRRTPAFAPRICEVSET
jgi:hypothetical protein